MFRFPSDAVQRRLWVRAIKGEKWQSNAYLRIYSDHFISSEFMSFCCSYSISGVCCNVYFV